MCQIYLATNRKPNRNVNTTEFGKVFSEDGIANLRFGKAEFFDNQFHLQLVQARLIRDNTGTIVDRNKSILGIQHVFSALRQEMKIQEKDTIVFIHGYNVSFMEGLEAAKRMTKNITEVANGRGENIALFSW